MMIFEKTFKLANGVGIPALGLGTWEIPDDKAAQAVRNAVKIGYRHIDTAQGYDNERGIGEGILNCGISRDKIFVTTKLQAFYKTYHEAKKAIDDSLSTAKLDYFDMMLIHAPQPWTDFRNDNHYFDGNLEAWRAMEEAYKAGKLRAIGISNFEKEDIDNLIKNGSVKPMVNQILTHITNTPVQLIDYCKSKNIVVEAYSPVGHGVMIGNSAVTEMAEKYGVSVPRLCVRYCLQLGLVVLPKTANPEHMKDNAMLDFNISDEDMKILMTMETIKNYGEFASFPVFGGKMNKDFSCTGRDFIARK